MKIGIGCTTYNRPECLAKWKEQIAKHTSMDNVLIYIAEDTDQDRQGVAKRKNECLRALKDCDHIFLFDDDCWPIKNGWVEFFVEANFPHLLFLNSSHGHMMNGITNDPRFTLEYYMNCGGVFMYMSKDVVERVGAFNEKFRVWGFEHAEYSQRVYDGYEKYQFSPYVMLRNTNEYLHAEDYSNPTHESSISDEEKKKHFNENFPKFKEPIKNISIPL